jgi:hypothetical protein
MHVGNVSMFGSDLPNPDMQSICVLKDILLSFEPSQLNL